MSLKFSNVSVAFCPLCIIISETELGAKYPATWQASVPVNFLKFIGTFRDRINIQRVAVEKPADVEVDLCLRLPLPITDFNPLNPELNPICYLLALLGAHHFLHISSIRVKLLTFRLLMSYIYRYIYIYGASILDVSRSHTTTQHSR